MPVFRIVYIDDDTFAPRTLSAAFADRAAAEIAMAKHGHRVVHIAEMAAGETHRDPIGLRMAPECDASTARSKPRESRRAVGARPHAGLPSYDLAGAAVVAAGIVIAGAVLLLF